MVSQSSGNVLAMLHEDDGTYHDDKTLQYLLLLIFKITLNTLILSVWKQNITKSLLGIFSIFLYLADLLLICSIIWAWCFRQNLSGQEGICLSLSHSSTVYSMLPPLALLGGVVDYAVGQQEDSVKKSLARTFVHFVVVLLMWTIACFYSYHYTHSELLIIKYQEGLDALVCPVQECAFVSHFTSKLPIVVLVILMLKFQKLAYWFQLTKRPWYLGTCSHITSSDLAFSWKPDRLEEGLEGTKQSRVIDTQQLPTLFMSLTLCFALSWLPYMVVSVICDLFAFAVPSYASVNLLWTACTNSLLAGLTFWYNSKKNGPVHTVPDVFCSWGVYWYLSKESRNEPSIKLYNGPSVL